MIEQKEMGDKRIENLSKEIQMLNSEIQRLEQEKVKALSNSERKQNDLYQVDQQEYSDRSHHQALYEEQKSEEYLYTQTNFVTPRNPITFINGQPGKMTLANELELL